MKEMLPYYERELAFLRRHSREFAERYPRLASSLLLNGERSEDPHVERMIESFALLAARVNKKIEDGYPEFTEALLSVLYPHYLRPFPSCSIAQFEGAGGASALSAPLRVPRHSELRSPPVKGLSCRFRTAWDVHILPVSIHAVRFEPAAAIPPSAALPAAASGVLSISLRAAGAGFDWRSLPDGSLRLFIDAEASLAAALRDCLFMRCIGAYVVGDDAKRWQPLPGEVVGEAGFGDDEALLDFPAIAHPAYRQLTEYFAFPEKFNFFELRPGALPSPLQAVRQLEIKLVVGGQQGAQQADRLLQDVSRINLRLSCAPVVNLFAQRGEPIRITHRQTDYSVVADARNAFGYEVYSIDRVSRVRKTPQGETTTEFRPFFSLRHGEPRDGQGRYWSARRDAMIAERSPGYETRIALVDSDLDPPAAAADTLSLNLTCTNRDLPSRLAIGMPGGDLSLDAGTAVRQVSLLRTPSPPRRFDNGPASQWRLISQLSLNQLSLSGSGLSAFKEMLRLYDITGSAVSRRQIDGIVAIDRTERTMWLPGKPFASFVRGYEVRLQVDEEHFVGSGLDLFARVIDRFLALHVHLNSFVQLVLISSRSGEELLRCAPRSGDAIVA